MRNIFAEHIQNVINGHGNGTLKNVDAILSGYQGSAE